MALVVADRVKESTATTGTGTVSLAGAETGFQTFVAGIGNSNTTYYAIVDGNTGDFEVGIGTVTDASPDTLSRDTILQSSNSDSAVNFGSGTKSVFCTLPADKAVLEDASGNISIPGTIDGRDLATDGTKLDGIEASATADQTASEILTAIKTVDGAGSGLDADTLDGTELAALATDAEVASIKQDIYNIAGAQYTLNGGGLVTVTDGNSIKWDTRILAIPVEKTEFGSAGFIDIICPTSGTIVYYSSTGTQTITCTSDGIPLPSWSGLYYQVTPGQSQTTDQTKFRVANYANQSWAPEEGWLLLAVLNADSSSAGITFLPNGGVKFPESVTSTFDTDAGVPSWLATAAQGATADAALPKAGGTMTGNLIGTQATTSASWTELSRFFANPAAENGEQTDVRLINDLAGFNKWGTETLTNIVTSHQGSTALTTLGDNAYDGTSSTRNIYQNASGDPNVILLELPHELEYSCWVGIVFGTTGFRAKSVKIETYRNGAYQTECDLTNQPNHIVARKVANNNNNGVTKIRITLDDYQNTSNHYIRIHTIFAVNFRAGNNAEGGVHYLSRFKDDEHYSNIAPATDSTYALGTTSKRYSNVYSDALDVGGNITVSGTVDGRDVAADGTKLDGIESSATADQTASEIRTLVESASDSNVFTDADHTKLNGIASSATANPNAISNLIEDTTPQLGGQLDLNGNNITTNSSLLLQTTNAAKSLEFSVLGQTIFRVTPTGVELADANDIAYFGGDGTDGGVTLANGYIDIKGKSVSEATYVNFYCESSNAHAVKLQAPAHADFSGNITTTLPNTTGTLVTSNAQRRIEVVSSLPSSPDSNTIYFVT